MTTHGTSARCPVGVEALVGEAGVLGPVLAAVVVALATARVDQPDDGLAGGAVETEVGDLLSW